MTPASVDVGADETDSITIEIIPRIQQYRSDTINPNRILCLKKLGDSIAGIHVAIAMLPSAETCGIEPIIAEIIVFRSSKMQCILCKRRCFNCHHNQCEEKYLFHNNLLLATYCIIIYIPKSCVHFYPV